MLRADADFRKQILEDINEYMELYPNITNIGKREWALNFWILAKLFSEEEELIEEKIIDYNDKGVDCFIWHEDLKDLYLIQNKYYADESKITNDYVQNDFLTRSIGALEKGTYTRSKELQDIFNKYKDEEEFVVHFHLYVTNNTGISTLIREGLKEFNSNHSNYIAKAYGLDDIEELYYGEPLINKKSMSFEIKTINKGTILSINTEAYNMNQAIDARYVLVSVVNLYQMYTQAKKIRYPIFDKNIREYLGSNGSVNKKIMETLKNPEERKNFFYYNNGITIICKDMLKTENIKGKLSFKIQNPQIVNGCQTVSTIYETLKNLPEESLEENFKDSYVMVKILKIDEKTEQLEKLYEDIVRYNNSQNAINEKTFVANNDEFIRIQNEFERKGFLLTIKQSDKYKYLQKYKTATTLLNRSANLLEKFGLEYTKSKDFVIDLEKFLQVVLAFTNDAQEAVQKKSLLLKSSSTQNTAVLDFIKSNKVSINDMLELYLLYQKCERLKKKSSDGKSPIPFYVIDCFSKFECREEYANIQKELDTKAKINDIVRLYSSVTKMYYIQWLKENTNQDYNSMIKSKIDYDKMKDNRELFLEMNTN